MVVFFWVLINLIVILFVVIVRGCFAPAVSSRSAGISSAFIGKKGLRVAGWAELFVHFITLLFGFLGFTLFFAAKCATITMLLYHLF